MNIKEYSVCYGESLIDLISNVSIAIKNGFQPFGSISPMSINHSIRYYQAIVKYE